MPKIFVSTSPFGEVTPEPITLLEETGWDFKINPLERKLTPDEVAEMASNCDGLIAGTENIDIVLKKAKRLKIISRVGIGLDSVPLQKCRDMGITVTYTPDAVTMAVAELTIGIMISLTRHVSLADRDIRKGKWKRIQGKRVGKSIIGIIGFGRIGINTVKLLASFKPNMILINDILDKTLEIKQLENKGIKIRYAQKNEIYQKADIISIHTPLTKITRNMINKKTFAQINNNAYLLNMARGGWCCFPSG